MKIGRAFTSLIPLAVAAPVLLRAQPALACAACFGKADSTLAHGMNMGIFALLFVVGVMWVAFGAFFNIFVVIGAFCAIMGFVRLTSPR